MTKLFLVRHGDTKLNSRERFWGKTDVPLSEAGIAQAKSLRKRLSGYKFDTIYSSTLGRCMTTAKIIAQSQGATPQSCEDLNEIDFGFIEGLTFEEIKQKHPDLAQVMSIWKSRPAFPGGESFDQLNERVLKFASMLDTTDGYGKVLVVAHAGIIRLLICNLMKINIVHWRQMRIDLASLSYMDIYKEGAILSLLNDTSHLF
jgi:alpha-ribazole phosphatase